MSGNIHEIGDQLKPFDWDLKITKHDIPDPQNFHQNSHASIRLPKVGISNLVTPVTLASRDGANFSYVKGTIEAFVSMDDTVSRGINMSRLARGFYDVIVDKNENGQAVTLADFVDVTTNYRNALPSNDAFVKVSFDYPYIQKHWREEHYGWLYYPTCIEIENTQKGGVKAFITIVYTYNSACPCSYQLAQFSQKVLNTPAISHSQRSEATIRCEIDPNAVGADFLWIEDLIDLCRSAQPSEVLGGIVTRVGEFSMAQMVASTELKDGDGNVVQQGAIGFIEDVLRRFWSTLNKDGRIKNFNVKLVHYEALNANFAAGEINKNLE